MRMIAFAGPSLRNADRAVYQGVEWRPPAEAGDLLRLLGDPPDRICLIDGYFDQRPAVRHKEILLLLSAGVRIYGASSIGALRAAEMDGQGMIGIGEIYRAYRDGRITGDDEVALLHAPAALDWRPLSVPLIDVRVTLDAAVAAHVIARGEADALLSAAIAIFYQDRDWRSIFDRAGWPERFAAPVLGWLQRGAISQKTLDAHACIAATLAGAGIGAGAAPMAVIPGFVGALARECGLEDPALLQAPRGTA